jgi:hypothetical protein
MFSRSNPRPDPREPDRDPIDTTKRYDVYCAERGQHVIVYRNALFKGVRTLYARSKIEALSGFVELEQSNGQTLFIQRLSVIRFCEPGTVLTAESVPSK